MFNIIYFKINRCTYGIYECAFRIFEMPAPIHDPRHKVIAQKLTQLRKDRGLLQIDIAQRLHRPQTFVSKVESGHRRVDILELLDILKALEADPHAFVDEVMTLNKYDTQAGA